MSTTVPLASLLCMGAYQHRHDNGPTSSWEYLSPSPFERFPSAQSSTKQLTSDVFVTPPVPTLTLMSQTHPTHASSSNFQVIFNNALRAYEKQTKKDLLSHPLASQLQACDSPSAILDVLRQQVQELDQSQNSHEGLTKWLDPTVNVLYAFSDTIAGGVSLVCRKWGFD